MANFTSLIFDFDGTLGDTFDSQLEVLKKVAVEEGIISDENLDIEKHKKLNIKEIIRKYKIGPLQLKRIIKKSQMELNKSFDQVEFFKGLEPILKSLANDYQLGILSSNSQENIGKFLKSKKLEIFDFVYTGSNLFAKDKIFKKIIRQEQLNKNQILYFGDEIRDIEACQKLGIKIAAVTWGFDDLEILKKAKPDYLISKPKEIKKILSI